MQRRSRLAGSGDFRRVMAGTRLLAGRHLVGLAAPGRADASRVGVTTSRQLRSAVQRNRARRRLRELARTVLLADDSPLTRGGIPYDVVLIARPSLLAADMEELRAEAARVLRALERS